MLIWDREFEKGLALLIHKKEQTSNARIFELVAENESLKKQIVS